MSTTQKFRSDAAIYARREQEYKLAKLTTDINGDKNLAHKAHWEAKTNQLIEKNLVRNRIADMKRRQASDLEARKARLAALLAAEDQMYEKEFMANLETPEQVREKMFERLQQLKGQRENERQSEVERRLEQRFKTANDELRLEESKFYTNGTAIEREKQLMDKRRKLEQEMQEEQVYAQLWKLDEQNKIAREQREAAEKQKLVQDQMAVLDWQKQTREMQRENANEMKKSEQSMLKTQWQSEEEREKEAERQRFLLNRERNLELAAHNATEKELRAIAEQADRQRDKDMLDTALARERAIEQIEQEERIKQKAETIELQKYLTQQKQDKAEYERMIEQLVAEENSKQWQQREHQWRREDKARINLLKNVYQNREADIELKKKLKDEQLWLKNNEKEQIQAEITRQEQEHQEKTMRQAIERKGHQTDILRQVGERDRTMRRDLQEKMYEERAAKLAELEYQRRIEAGKGTNNQMLSTWKQTLGTH